MATTTERIEQLLLKNGSNAIYHRDTASTPCPCRTPEGSRDPIWHIQHPLAPDCDASGMLPSGVVDITVKAFIQPIQSTRATRLSTEQVEQLFGEVQADDHLGIFPIYWSGRELDFFKWGLATEDWIGYNNRKFQVVNANLIPAPEGDPKGHWECGLRLLGDL
jgi:hypothetical protein